MRRIAILLALALVGTAIPVALALTGSGAIDVIYPDPQPAERIRPIAIDGVRYISTSDLSRIFRATKYWRPELRKLSLRLGDHTIRFTVDAPVIQVDDVPRNLVQVPRLVQGAVYVPESVLGGPSWLEWDRYDVAAKAADGMRDFFTRVSA